MPSAPCVDDDDELDDVDELPPELPLAMFCIAAAGSLMKLTNCVTFWTTAPPVICMRPRIFCASAATCTIVDQHLACSDPWPRSG